MKMTDILKKYVLPNLPYLIFLWFFAKVGEAVRLAPGVDASTKLLGLADGFCIVTVHHTRKQPAGDSFETISGTTGLLGCADGALLMQKKKKRTALEATVDAVGRDQQD